MGHKVPINQVAWASSDSCDDLNNPTKLRLASADRNGVINVWDVSTASLMSTFEEFGTEVLDMKWLPRQGTLNDFLGVLHSNSKFILWNTQTSSPLWKKQFSENLISFSLDVFNPSNVLFVGQGAVIFVEDFSFHSEPKSSGRRFVIKDTSDSLEPASQRTFTSSIKNTAKAVISKSLFGSQPRPLEAFARDASSRDHTILQVFLHSFRNHVAVFVYARKIMLLDLHLLETVETIELDRYSARLVRVYSCRQRDVFICLHENGSVSVRGCLNRADQSLKYVPLAASESPRRSRSVRILGMAVDEVLESLISTISSDGRIQTWTLLSPVNQLTCLPLPTIAELTPPNRSSPLRLQLSGSWLGMSQKPTVCRVCHIPWLMQLPGPERVECLVAVGNESGGVQLWDLHAARIWREYQVLPVPIAGIEWCPINQANQLQGLALLLHGKEPVNQEEDVSSKSPKNSASAPSYRNYLAYVNLMNGQVMHLRDECLNFGRVSAEKARVHATSTCTKIQLVPRADRLRQCALQTSRSKMKDALFEDTSSGTLSVNGTRHTLGTLETAIERVALSFHGQYFCIVFAGQPIEIWDAQRLQLLNYVQLPNIAAVHWYTGNLNPEHLNIGSPEARAEGTASEGLKYKSESFLVIPRRGVPQLVMVNGAEAETSPLTQALTGFIPAFNVARVSDVSWCLELLAVGTSDGYVAVKNLSTNVVATRYTVSGKMPSEAAVNREVMDAAAETNGLDFLSTGVRRLCFLPGPSIATKLCVLTFEAVFIWLPRTMQVLSTLRFGMAPFRSALDVDWATHSGVSPRDEAPFCVLLFADGTLRVSAVAHKDHLDAVQEQTQATHSSSKTTSSGERPLSEFQIVSPIKVNAQLDCDFHLTLPSILPLRTSLLAKSLLQHQPWGGPSVELKCPNLSQGFARLQEDCNYLFAAITRRPSLAAGFQGNLIERCHLVAKLFGNAYEQKFWCLVGHQLLFRKGLSSAAQWRLNGSWEILSEFDGFRAEMRSRLRMIESHRSTEQQNAKCVELLLQVGEYRRAAGILLETPPEHQSYTQNMYKACLVSATSSLRRHEADREEQKENESFHVTATIVANEMIVQGKFREGLEMLCLVGRQEDACQHLLERGELRSAVWLAKSSLSEQAGHAVIRKWAASLASESPENKSFAVLVFVFLGDHVQAFQLLASLHQYQLAARYAESLVLFGATETMEAKQLDQFNTQKADVFLEFARILQKLGHKQSATHYAREAGAKGTELMQEIEFLLT